MTTRRDLMSLLLKLAGIVLLAWAVMTAVPKLLSVIANARSARVGEENYRFIVSVAVFWFVVVPVAISLSLVRGSDAIARRLFPGEETAPLSISLDAGAVVRAATSMVGLVLVVTRFPVLWERIMIYLVLARPVGNNSILLEFDRFYYFRLATEIVTLLLGVGLFFRADLVPQLLEWHRNRQRDEQLLLEAEVDTLSSDGPLGGE
jgi:hypothetical protein